MATVESFPPVIGTDPKILILGSMPGVESLQRQQYYAHPRNAFWPIMEQLFSVQWSEQYEDRIEQLKDLPLILWDVLKSCQREGSLDSSIKKDQLEANEIETLLRNYSTVKMIVFNGATAEKFFHRFVANDLINMDQYRLLRLPSTSPAHASMNFKQKLESWQSMVDAVL